MLAEMGNVRNGPRIRRDPECGDQAESIHSGHSPRPNRAGSSSPKNRKSRALQLKPGKAASHRAERLDILNVYG
jgi:hypothetical protein